MYPRRRCGCIGSGCELLLAGFFLFVLGGSIVTLLAGIILWSIQPTAVTESLLMVGGVIFGCFVATALLYGCMLVVCRCASCLDRRFFEEYSSV